MLITSGEFLIVLDSLAYEDIIITIFHYGCRLCVRFGRGENKRSALTVTTASLEIDFLDRMIIPAIRFDVLFFMMAAHSRLTSASGVLHAAAVWLASAMDHTGLMPRFALLKSHPCASDSRELSRRTCAIRLVSVARAPAPTNGVTVKVRTNDSRLILTRFSSNIRPKIPIHIIITQSNLYQ